MNTAHIAETMHRIRRYEDNFAGFNGKRFVVRSFHLEEFKSSLEYDEGFNLGMIVQRHEGAGGNLPSQTQYAPRVSRLVIFSLTAAPSNDSSSPSLDIMCRGMGLFGDSIWLD